MSDESKVRLTYSGQMTPEIDEYLRAVEREMNKRNLAEKLARARDDFMAFGVSVIRA